jgi:competence protein ComGC
MTILRIENNNYLAALYQSQSTKATNSSSNSSSVSPIESQRFDMVEISSDAYNAYANFLNGTTSSPSHSKAFESLVNDGTITSDQASVIKNAMSSDSIDVSDGSNPLKAVLDSLISDGTITSDQEDAIVATLALEDSDATSDIQMDKPMGPPPPPPKDSEDDGEDDYLQEFLQSLVDSSNISDDQKASIESILNLSSSDSESESNPLQAALNSLISDGTITRDQASAVAEALAPPDAE